MNYLCSVVIVGDRFDPGMFDAKDVFGGEIDPGSFVVGPIAQYSYRRGSCALHLSPDRLDLRVNSLTPMSIELVEAATVLAGRLDEVRHTVVVSGVGLNCDWNMPVAGGGKLFCQNLVSASALGRALDPTVTPDTFLSLRYWRDEIAYTVKLEPHQQSQGQNLFVAVNGHQTAEPKPIGAHLVHHTDFAEHAGAIYDRLSSQA
jgi:hypothetical protein